MECEDLIRSTLRHIDNSFRELQKSLSTYENNENIIETNLDRMQRIMDSSLMNSPTRSEFGLIFTLIDTNNRIKRINDTVLREIDNMVSLITGYLSVLIDECIEHYKSVTKIQIRIRIQRLSDMRELSIGIGKRYLSFPTAVATLSPYLIKTKFSDNSSKLVSIRQAIVSLSEPSY